MALHPPLLIRENMNYIVSNSIDIAIRKTSNLILTFFHSFVIVDQKTSKKKNIIKKTVLGFHYENIVVDLCEEHNQNQMLMSTVRNMNESKVPQRLVRNWRPLKICCSIG